MDAMGKLAKNTFILIIANAMSMLLGIIFNIYIANYLGVDNYGLLNVVIGLTTIVMMVTDVGASLYVTFTIAKSPDVPAKYLNNVLGLKLVLVAIGYISIIAGALLFGFSGDRMSVVYLIGLYAITISISTIFQSVFQAKQSMAYIAVGQVLNPAILIVGLLYSMATGQGVVALAIVYLVSGAVILLYYLFFTARKFTVPLPSFDTGMWKLILAGGMPFYLSNLFAFLYYKIDIQVIGFMAGDAAAGYYSAAYKLIEALIYIPIIFGMVIFPAISAYYHSKDNNLDLVIQKSIKYLYVIGLPTSVGTFLMADKIIYLMYPKLVGTGGAIVSIDVLRMLAFSLVIIFLYAVPSNIMLGTNMQKNTVYLNILGTLFIVVANIALLPVYGVVGSAAAMLLTHSLMFILYFYMVRKQGYHMLNIMDILKVSLCAAVMGLFVFVAHDFNMGLVIPAAIVLYVACIFLTGSISIQEIKAVLSSLKKEKGPG